MNAGGGAHAPGVRAGASGGAGRWTLLVAPLGVALFAMGVWLTVPASPAYAATAQVQVGTYWFCNYTYTYGTCATTINLGDTVQWNFPSDLSHSTTECGASCDAPTGSPLWNSGFLIGGSFSHTFTQAGVFTYQCALHGAIMRGKITVAGPPSGVGGIASLPGVEGAALDGGSRSAGGVGLFAGAAVMAAGMIALAGSGWYARRQRSSSRDHRS